MHFFWEPDGAHFGGAMGVCCGLSLAALFFFIVRCRSVILCNNPGSQDAQSYARHGGRNRESYLDYRGIDRLNGCYV